MTVGDELGGCRDGLGVCGLDLGGRAGEAADCLGVRVARAGLLVAEVSTPAVAAMPCEATDHSASLDQPMMDLVPEPKVEEALGLNQLPSELLLMVLSQVPPRMLIRHCRQVCRRWRALVDCQDLWLIILARDHRALWPVLQSCLPPADDTRPSVLGRFCVRRPLHQNLFRDPKGEGREPRKEVHAGLWEGARWGQGGSWGTHRTDPWMRGRSRKSEHKHFLSNRRLPEKAAGEQRGGGGSEGKVAGRHPQGGLEEQLSLSLQVTVPVPHGRGVVVSACWLPWTVLPLS